MFYVVFNSDHFQDKFADLIIHGYCDEILTKLAELLNVDVPEYKVSQDPTQTACEVQEYVSYIPLKTEDYEIKKEETQECK